MTQKTTPNDPCPCGSGEKYKNCCLRHRDRLLDQRTISALVLVVIGSVLAAAFFHTMAFLAIGLVAVALILIGGLRARRHRVFDYDELRDGVALGHRPPDVRPPSERSRGRR